MSEQDFTEVERSTTVHGGLGGGNWPFAVAIEHTRTTRRRQFGDRIEELSGLSSEDVAAAAETDERKLNAIAVSDGRIRIESDEPYREAIARLVAAAFVDDAKLDERLFLLRTLVQLEPIHLRALAAVQKREIENSEQVIAAAAKSVSPVTPLPVQSRQVGALINASPGIGNAVVEKLRASGLVTSDQGSTQIGMPPSNVPGAVFVSQLGQELLSECHAGAHMS